MSRSKLWIVVLLFAVILFFISYTLLNSKSLTLSAQSDAQQDKASQNVARMGVSKHPASTNSNQSKQPAPVDSNDSTNDSGDLSGLSNSNSQSESDGEEGNITGSDLVGSSIEKVTSVEEGGESSPVQSMIEDLIEALLEQQMEEGQWPKEEFRDFGFADTTVTAFALLALNSVGHAPKKDAETVEGKAAERAMQYILSKQREDGSFHDSLYQNALIVLALVESYGMSGNKELLEPVQVAVDYIESVQNVEGGWPEHLEYEASDMMSTGWHVLALKSAKISGVKVDKERLQKSLVWMVSLTNRASGIVYEGHVELSTAVGIMARVMTGQRHNDEMNRKGIEVLLKNPPQHPDEFEYWYWGTLAIFQAANHEQSMQWMSNLKDSLNDHPMPASFQTSSMAHVYRILQASIFYRYKTIFR